MRIQKGVPFPEKPKCRDLFDQMAVGDSILFPQFRSTRDAPPYGYAKESEWKNGFKFKGRATPEGLRIWRVE